MNIIAKCPQCGCSWILDGNAADKRVRCFKCKTRFKVPRMDEMSEALEKLDGAKESLFVDQKGKIYG